MKELSALLVVTLLLVGGALPALPRSQESVSPATLKQGAELYDEHCAQCHLQGRSRIKKLNLIDGKWRHGNGSLDHLIEVIGEGIEATQMQPFKDRLSPAEIRSIGIFVLRLAEEDDD